MLSFNKYVRAESLDEAYTLYQKRRNVILGGTVWLKMSNITYNTAIDLCDLGLDKIESDEQCFSIGAMVTLHQLETDPALNAYTHGAIAEAVRHIVGVQFRNCATVGGSVYGRFGFSDVITVLMALGAQVELYKAGVMPLADFVRIPRTERDILLRIILPRTAEGAAYLSMRNTATDFPVLTCAVARADGQYRCAVGARPSVAALYTDDTLGESFTEEQARAVADRIAESAHFGSNIRGGADYRRQLCRVLVRRALMQSQEVLKHAD